MKLVCSYKSPYDVHGPVTNVYVFQNLNLFQIRTLCMDCARWFLMHLDDPVVWKEILFEELLIWEIMQS